MDFCPGGGVDLSYTNLPYSSDLTKLPTRSHLFCTFFFKKSVYEAYFVRRKTPPPVNLHEKSTSQLKKTAIYSGVKKKSFVGKICFESSIYLPLHSC